MIISRSVRRRFVREGGAAQVTEQSYVVGIGDRGVVEAQGAREPSRDGARSKARFHGCTRGKVRREREGAEKIGEAWDGRPIRHFRARASHARPSPGNPARVRLILEA